MSVDVPRRQVGRVRRDSGLHKQYDQHTREGAFWATAQARDAASRNGRTRRLSLRAPGGPRPIERDRRPALPRVSGGRHRHRVDRVRAVGHPGRQRRHPGADRRARVPGVRQRYRRPGKRLI